MSDERRCICGHDRNEHLLPPSVCWKCSCNGFVADFNAPQPVDMWKEPPADRCPACEGTGNGAVHGLDPAPCSLCNGTGKAQPVDWKAVADSQNAALKELPCIEPLFENCKRCAALSAYQKALKGEATHD